MLWLVCIKVKGVEGIENGWVEDALHKTETSQLVHTLVLAFLTVGSVCHRGYLLNLTALGTNGAALLASVLPDMVDTSKHRDSHIKVTQGSKACCCHVDVRLAASQPHDRSAHITGCLGR